MTAGAEMLIADVAVIGAGPAGIAAAVCAAERGLRVVALDRALEPGGQIWRHVNSGPIPQIARRWLARLDKSGARIMPGTSVVDASSDASGFQIIANSLGHAQIVRTTSVILATGAREMFIPFEGWTLPGVMGIGGAQALLKSGASFSGKRVIIAGSGPLMLPVAAALASAGAKLLLVAEQASLPAVARFAVELWKTPTMLLQAAQYRARFLSTPFSTGTWVTAAHGAGRLESVTVTNGRRTWREPVDILCSGYGLIPNIELAQLIGCETRDGCVFVDARQRTSIRNVLAVGETTGIGGAPLSLVEGEIAGMTVGSTLSPSAILLRRRATFQTSARRMFDAFAPRAELRALPAAETIVCRCEDVTYGSVQHATCARQAKLYTRAGMGPCQGRTCMPGLEFLLAWHSDTVRPPIEPATVSILSSGVADNASSSFASNSCVGDVF
ncbi:MAG: FAD-dependent oxidoreductase [Gemmatimonadaceae bacterium]